MVSVAAPGAISVIAMPSTRLALSCAHMASAAARASLSALIADTRLRAEGDGAARRLSLSCPTLEDRLAFFHEGAHALGVILGAAGLALQIALERELLVERV